MKQNTSLSPAVVADLERRNQIQAETIMEQEAEIIALRAGLAELRDGGYLISQRALQIADYALSINRPPLFQPVEVAEVGKKLLAESMCPNCKFPYSAVRHDCDTCLWVQHALAASTVQPEWHPCSACGDGDTAMQFHDHQPSPVQVGTDETVDDEIRRLQDGIHDHLITLGAPDYLIDGAGCDSGDPLDFTKAEITQAFSYFEDQRVDEASKALEELREMFPDGRPSIQVYVWFKPEGYRAAIYEFGATLSEAMAKVREWKQEQRK